MKSILKRTFTAVAAGGLLLGAAACSDDDSDSVSDASSAAESGAAEASDAMGGSDSTEAESTETDGADDAEGSEGSGDTELPEGLQAAYDEAGGEQGEWGAVQNVESADGATLATFDNGWAVENDSGEVTPLIGMIGETWANDGGLENEIGLPTAPESGDAMQGWTQQFENGTISWMQDEDGTWDADVEGNE